tara:strand:+ start:993 stop:1832 length:840 start_codon:yes stop_codon:yes gene_type:complete
MQKVRIKTIKKIEPEARYDIEVKDNNNFFANNILVHNCRCVSNIQTSKMISRGGNEIMTMGHIANSLSVLRQRYPLLEWVDGELFAENINFNDMMSIISNANHHQHHIIKYNIFDIIKDEPMDDRYHRLRFLDISYIPHLEKVFTHLVPVKEIDIYHKMFVNDGHEGSIIRLPDATYKHKKTNALLKYKDMDDDEYIIIGFEEVRGGGHLGKFILRDKDNTIEFSGALKDTAKVKTYIWNNQDEFMDREVTVQYQDINPKTGIPRFPVVIKIHPQGGKN